MARRLVSAEELLQIVNKSLVETLGPGESGEKTLVSGIYRVNEPDAGGCNWTPGFYRHQRVNQSLYAQVITELQKKYNVID